MPVFKNKKYKNALEFISKSKLFPENLGSGKPYDEDIDYRTEDYLTAICSEKMNKKNAMADLFKKIASCPEIKDGYKSNIILQAWAMKITGHEKTANEFIEKKLAAEKNIPFAEWARAIYYDRPQTFAKPKDGNMLLTEAIADFGKKE